ncbi:MAG: ATP-binding cassette domain-containing protein [Eggerthellaceae bacterium]|nr:ATP-binding cassette domain-containing protein [Eggerthellaceae bacterium]
MLQLNNICKSYTTGSFTQKALDDVSISFRDNEFVAILGPSGSGKTTLLNIIGGLDHYDSGDLIIDGVSTKEYKDRDWDAYRNNRIGFVFQSYNLIPHQTVLANVELALTLSGVSREERHERAVKALERVGLAEHIDKKPAQMSGGQMQRVAIARALINDPEILLADEPTGALDSKTSVQIMDLLTEIADDRLVIMVTHNPDLAEQYATRTVNLADGRVTSDSNPFTPSIAEIEAANAKPTRRTRMSFLTALTLSANNLMTKKGRTIMTAIAGSIGIIGIAAILALANGVNNYIKTTEEETLSVYPLQILSSGFDFTTMIVGMGGADDEGDDESTPVQLTGTSGSSSSASASSASVSNLLPEVEEGHIGEFQMMTRMFASFGNNDLASLKEYLDSGESGIDNYVSSIYYEYAVTPQIFDADTSEKVRQINPDTSFSSLGIGSGASTNSLVSMSMSTDMFAEMMENGVVADQYDVVAGHWPEKENELVLVLSQTGRISDFLAYVIGLRDKAELDEMVKQFTDEKEVVAPTDRLDLVYDDVLGMKFKLVSATDFYKYDEEYNVWVDKSGDEEYMRDIVNNGEDIEIVGIVRPKPESNALALTMGIYYTPALTRSIVDKASESQIVKDQLADRDRDVFSGKTFDEMDEEEGSEFDMSSLFSINESALQNAFYFNSSALDFSSIDMSGSNVPPMDLSGMTNISMPQPSQEEIAALFQELTSPAGQAAITNSVVSNLEFTDDGAALNSLVASMGAWMAMHPGSNPSDFFNTPEGQAAVAAVGGAINTEKLQSAVTQAVAQQLGTTPDGVGQVMADRVANYYAAQMIPVLQAQLTTAIQDYMTNYMTQLSGQMTSVLSNIGNAMGVNPDAFANAFQINMDQDELTELMMSMMRVEEHSYDNNLKKLGYADFNKPSEISIFPRDFESKEHVIEILDGYNAKMREVDEDKVISYTDLVGTLMESVTDIVNMISYVLIAFVAISLIVSSIMIGVITYISVLERKKEIGILRSIGASKGDISRVFNAETVIEGLIAGLLGVGVTALGCIPANIIVYNQFDVPNIAILPVDAAVILVAISVFLTFIAGLIPSRSASRKDPVEALRSE